MDLDIDAYIEQRIEEKIAERREEGADSSSPAGTADTSQPTGGEPP